MEKHGARGSVLVVEMQEILVEDETREGREKTEKQDDSSINSGESQQHSEGRGNENNGEQAEHTQSNRATKGASSNQ